MDAAGPIFLRLSNFYAWRFLAVGIQLPFWPVWLQGRGLDAVQISIVLSAGTWLAIVTGPAIARLVDTTGRRRPVIAALAVATGLTPAFLFLADGFVAILAISVAYAVAHQALGPLGETITMAHARRLDLNYGRIRLWGSLSFILASVAMGQILEKLPTEAILWALSAAALVYALSCFTLPMPPPTQPPTPPAGEKAGPVRALLRQPNFALFLATTACVHASHGVYYVFATLHWRAAGHGTGLIGLLWAEGVIAEVILFALGHRLLRRLSPMRLLGLSCAFAALRWAVTAQTTALEALVVVQALHAFSFAGVHLAAIHHLSRTIPVHAAATAQALYGAIGFSAATGLAMWLAGPLYTVLEGQAFWPMAALAATGCALALRLTGAAPTEHGQDTRRV